MTAQASAPQPPVSPAPVSTTADANQLAGHYVEVMDALIGVIQQETELVRIGRLSQVAALEPTKTELARRYIGYALSPLPLAQCPQLPLHALG